MSTYPSSTYADDGSVNDFHPLPAIQALAREQAYSNNSATAHAFATQRINTYLHDSIDSQPRYQHNKTSTSMAAHSRGMKAELRKFDEVMNKHKHKG